MKSRNPMQLKALIKNKAKDKNISAQLVMQNYILERFLERLSLSKYRNNFIIKGGFLISAIVGLEYRSTMDIDMTIKGLTLSHDMILNIFSEICNIPIDDDIKFEIMGINDIREEDDYPGIRVSLMAAYPPLNVPLAVDVTTGDIITPREIMFSFPKMFDEDKLNVLSNNLETILAEKFETIIARGIANTRARDFYDIYVLCSLYESEIDYPILRKGLLNTSTKRGSNRLLLKFQSIIPVVFNDDQMKDRWKRYQNKYNYAKQIAFDEIGFLMILILDQLDL